MLFRSYYIYAQVSYNRGELQSSQFELHPATEDGDFPSSFGAILPIYPLRGALTQRLIRANVRKVLGSVDQFEEELPPSLRAAHSLMPMDEAIRIWHFPPSLAEHEEARKTLALDELFYLQLIARRRKGFQQGEAQLRSANPTKIELALIESLPFSLTSDQITVLHEVRKDLAGDVPMNRLLQGDVGSGKIGRASCRERV